MKAGEGSPAFFVAADSTLLSIGVWSAVPSRDETIAFAIVTAAIGIWYGREPY